MIQCDRVAKANRAPGQAMRFRDGFSVRFAPNRSSTARSRTKEAVSRFQRAGVAGSAGREQTPFRDCRSMTLFPDSIRRVANADGGIVMDLRRGTMFRVNPLGAKVLDLLDLGNSPREIAEKLSAEYNVAPNDVHTDIEEFIESLKIHGVLAQ